MVGRRARGVVFWLQVAKVIWRFLFGGGSRPRQENDDVRGEEEKKEEAASKKVEQLC